MKLRIPKKTLSVFATVLMGACGGGDNYIDTANVTASANLSEIDPEIKQVKRSLSEASLKGIEKTAYVIDNNFGVYGSILKRDGWTFKLVKDYESIPNEQRSIVYFNSDNSNSDIVSVASKLSKFAGAIIIDSNQKINSGIIKDENIIATDDSDIDSNLVKFIASLDEKIIGAPKSSAIIISLNSKQVMGLSVDDEDRVNGFEFNQLEFISPQLFVLSNFEEKNISSATQSSEQSFEEPKYLTSRGTAPLPVPVAKYSSPTTDAYTGIINGSTDLAKYRAKYSIAAYRDTGPTFANANKYVRVRINSGSSTSSCTVGTLPCGIYPNETLRIEQKGGGRIAVTAFPHIYRAQVRVNPSSTQSLEWQPNKKSFTNLQKTTAPDAWERTYSKGFSIGGGPSLNNAGVATLGLGFNYTQAQSYTQWTFPWVGFEDRGQVEGGDSFVTSGIESRNQSFRKAVHSPARIFGDTPNDSEAVMNLKKAIGKGALLRGDGCTSISGGQCNFDEQSINEANDSSARSAISWGGFTPSLEAVFQIPTDAFFQNRLKVINVKSQLVTEHWKMAYDYYPNGFMKPGKSGADTGGYELVAARRSDGQRWKGQLKGEVIDPYAKVMLRTEPLPYPNPAQAIKIFSEITVSINVFKRDFCTSRLDDKGNCW